MRYTDHITHYHVDAELFDYFDEGAGATKDFDRRLRSYILHLCDLKPGWSILDVGSGSGWVVRALASRGVHVISVDLSPKNLVRIRAEIGSNSTDFLVGDAYRLPFQDGSFDLVIASELLEHLESPSEGVRELQRVLGRGGRLVASTPYKEKIRYYLCIHCNKKTPANAHLHSFDERSLTSLFRSQNFSQVRFHKLGNKLLLYTRVYYLLRFLPFHLWRILDQFANFIVRKPAHIAAVVERD